MTPSRFRECLAVRRWSQRGFAQALACDDRMVRRWAAGEASIPEPIAEWLERRVTADQSDPIPRNWRRRIDQTAEDLDRHTDIISQFNNGMEMADYDGRRITPNPVKTAASRSKSDSIVEHATSALKKDVAARTE